MNKQRGFNIIELMLGIVIFGILLAFGLPNLTVMVNNNRLATEINAFSSSLALARSEAVKTNSAVIVCPSTDGAQCVASVVAAGSPWDVGWITFIDRNDDGNVDVDATGDPCRTVAASNYDANDDCILDYRTGLPTNMSLIARSNHATTGFPAIGYNGLGESVSTVSGTLGEAFWVMCDERGASFARGLSVTNTGRSQIAVRNASSQYVYPNGTAISSCTSVP
ncbi:MAG: GspH/FimT family pseudopilin [Pseudomonadota bacterium]